MQPPGVAASSALGCSPLRSVHLGPRISYVLQQQGATQSTLSCSQKHADATYLS